MTDINVGQITEALNDKSDRDLRNVDTTAKADAVIDYQEPTAENGYTWYRKYKSGWVVQGGKTAKNVSSAEIQLPIEMAADDYYISVVLHKAGGTGSGGFSAYPGVGVMTATSFHLDSPGDSNINFYWRVEGIAA